MKIIHFCAGLEGWNGMANTARQLVAEELARGDESQLTNDVGVIERTEKVDRVHIHGTWLPVLWKVARIAKRKGAELIVRPCGNYDPIRIRRGTIKRLKKWLVGPFEHAMLDRADFVQCTCAAEVEWVKAYHPKARIQMTDLKRFFDLKGRGRCPQRPATDEKRAIAFDDRCGGLRTSRPTETPRSVHLLYLGRRHPLKGVEFLEQAVEELKNHPHSNLNWQLELRCVSNHFGEELEQDWDWCDVLVLPTLSENFGRVVAEALERGKFVITTDGAPAWEPPEATEVKVRGEGEQWRDRIIYLKGFRDGTDEERVKLLKNELLNLARVAGFEKCEKISRSERY